MATRKIRNNEDFTTGTVSKTSESNTRFSGSKAYSQNPKAKAVSHRGGGTTSSGCKTGNTGRVSCNKQQKRDW